jgi:hypothetical protein
MALFSRGNTKHADLQARIHDYVEYQGMSSTEVLEKIQSETFEKLTLKEDLSRGVSETIPEEIKVISQALAYREALPEDLTDIYNILNQAYREEVEGEEAFRLAPVITKESVEQYLIHDKSYHWLVIETPNGYNVESDGAIIGVCCYSSDGISKRNGKLA